MISSRQRNKVVLFIFIFSLLTLPSLKADENKEWDIETAVSSGIKNSYTVQTERENLYKKQLSLKSVRPVGNITASLKGTMALGWSPDQNISLSESFNPVITFPVLKQIDIITEYTMVRGGLVSDVNDSDNGSLFLGINIKPLQNLKEISDYDGSLYRLNKEKLTWSNDLVKTEFFIRRAYIRAVEKISVRNLLELEYLNAKNIWIENEKRFKLGLVSKNVLTNSLLKKLKTGESLEEARENEYISLLKLSRLINADLSNVKLDPLLPFKPVRMDKVLLVHSVLSHNILLKQLTLKLKMMKRSMQIMKYDRIPDISIVPGIEIPVTDPVNWSSGLSINIEFSLDRSGKYTYEKKNIDIRQQERKIKMIQNALTDSITIALYKFKREKNKLEYFTAFLQQRNSILSEKKNAFKEKLLRRTELETARINVLKAKNSIQTVWDNLWLIWYSLEAARKGYVGSLE